VHALVETELGVPDGIWGCVADGVVWGSMRHVSGRRPPHGAERSDRLKRDRVARIQHAEGLADVVARLARGDEVLPQQLADVGVGPDRLAAAVGALQDAGRRWAALRPGEEWVVTWPARQPQRPVSRGRRR
jgi:hypothetical protein